jgi:hypothetical protein
VFYFRSIGYVCNVSSCHYYIAIKLVSNLIILSYGVNYSWGLFLRNYNQYVYVGQMTQLSWIGSICIALFFIIGPINEWVVRKLGYTKMLAIATILCPLALMLASISHEVIKLYYGKTRKKKKKTDLCLY